VCQGEGFGISLKPVAEHMKPVIEHIKPVFNHMKTQTENLKPVASHIQHTLVTKTSRLRLRMMSHEEKEEEEENPRETTRLSRNDSSCSSSKDSDRTLVNNAIETVESPDASNPTKPSFATARQRMRDMSPWIVTTRSELKEESLALWKSTSTTALNIVSRAENKSAAATTTRSRSYSHPSPDGLRPHTSSASVDTSPAHEPLQVVRVVTEKPVLSIQTHFHASPSTAERGGRGVSVISLPNYARHIRAKSKSKTKDTMVFVAAAYDGAKQKIADVQAARRRAGIKKQIHLVGPIDQYPDGSFHQWV
jgi:hypothetical protein